MPGTCCCVPGCSTRGGGHLFPSDESRKRAWILAIKRQDGQNKDKVWIPGQYDVVCKKHFLPEDYKETTSSTGSFLIFRLLEASV